MYYSDEILEEIRSRNEITDLISTYVKLKRTGSSLVGLCPFHNEKTPSFTVTPRKQMFYCFGCHRGGNVITFTQLYENCSFQEAVQMLAQRGGVALPQAELTEEDRQRETLRSRLYEVNRMAGAYFYYTLRSEQGRQGMDYLTGRGLNEEIMKRFGLGYAGKYSDGLYRYLKQKKVSDEILRASGLMGFDEKQGMYDKFWNRVMFPIMDLNNRIIGFGGRVMGDAKPKYLNSQENEIFNKRRNLYGLHIARRSREKFLILCEGYMDVIALHQAGFDCAVASLGTALTQEHAALLRRYTERVILSYDSDEAGINAALRAIPMLREQGLDVRVLALAPCKDPDEFIGRYGAGSFRERLENAKNGFVFEVEAFQRDYNLSDPDEKMRYLQRVAEKIASFELKAQRESYIEAAAPIARVDYDALRQMVEHALTSGVPRRRSVRPAASPEQPKPGEGLKSSQRLLLGWLTRYPSLYGIMKDLVPVEAFSDPLYRETAKLLYAQLESGEISEAAVLDHFPDIDDQARVAELFHSLPDVESGDELKKAVCENIIKVAESMASSEKGVQENDLSKISQRIERKRMLEKLKRQGIAIDLGEGGNEEDDPFI